MKLIHLYYLVEVIDHKSISKAAEKLFISQPALSTAIQSLEKELGHYLINRTSHGIESTDFGRQVYQKIKNIEQELADIRHLAKEMDENIEIKIATIPAASVLILPKVNAYFRQVYQNIKVTITEKPIPSSENSLSIDDYSFILTNANDHHHLFGAGVSKKKSLVTRALFRDKLAVYLNVQHPLRHKGSPITLDELSHYPTVLPASAVALMKSIGWQENKNTVVMYDRGSIERMIYKYPETIGLLPQVFALENIYLESGIFEILPLATPPAAITNYVLYDKTKTLSHPEKYYLNLLLEEGKRLEEALKDGP